MFRNIQENHCKRTYKNVYIKEQRINRIYVGLNRCFIEVVTRITSFKVVHENLYQNGYKMVKKNFEKESVCRAG